MKIKIDIENQIGMEIAIGMEIRSDIQINRNPNTYKPENWFVFAVVVDAGCD